MFRWISCVICKNLREDSIFKKKKSNRMKGLEEPVGVRLAEKLNKLCLLHN